MDEPEPVMSAILPDESVYIEHLLLRSFHRLVLLAGHGEQARRDIENGEEQSQWLSATKM
jgi:hypothetical protein